MNPPAPRTRCRTLAWRRTTVAAAFIVVVAGCAPDGALSPIRIPALPPQMRLVASAEGAANGNDIRCSLDLIVVAERAGDLYTGSIGGDAYRESLDQTRAGIAFWAEMYSESRLTFGADDRVSLVTMLDGRPRVATNESRFWDALLRFDGTLTAGDTVAHGSWTCAPMDVRGDDFGTIAGEWHLLRVAGP